MGRGCPAVGAAWAPLEPKRFSPFGAEQKLRQRTRPVVKARAAGAGRLGRSAGRCQLGWGR